MKIGHCTELLLVLITHLDENPELDTWVLEHTFCAADTWALKNPVDSTKFLKIKIHGSGLNIDIYTEGKPNYLSFWLSSDEHLPQLDEFFQEHFNLKG